MYCNNRQNHHKKKVTAAGIFPKKFLTLSSYEPQVVYHGVDDLQAASNQGYRMVHQSQSWQKQVSGRNGDGQSDLLTFFSTVFSSNKFWLPVAMKMGRYLDKFSIYSILRVLQRSFRKMPMSMNLVGWIQGWFQGWFLK